jgi:hypothetical protein
VKSTHPHQGRVLSIRAGGLSFKNNYQACFVERRLFFQALEEAGTVRNQKLQSRAG